MSVTVELTYDEALLINDLYRNLGGSPTQTRRRHADSVLRELRPYFDGLRPCCDIDHPVHMLSGYD